MASSRVIFHIDMNCFFASCEIAENENLRNKPIAVCGGLNDRKSMVLSASYEARAKGVYTTMLLYEAKKLCPNIIPVECRHSVYQEYSRKFFDYFYKLTPLVEPASIDEGFLDVTDCVHDNDYLGLAKKIQSDLLNIYKLPCSIGIAPNKFLAKMASDYKKPLGITILRKKDIKQIMWPLPIKDMYGCGKKTCEILNALGIKTIGDLATYKDQDTLSHLLGDNVTKSLIYHAYGGGSNNVDIDRINSVSSISNSHTFDYDEYNLDNIKALIKLLNNSVCSRLEKGNYEASTFTIQIKYNNFKMFSKSMTLDHSTNDSKEILNIYLELFDELYDYELPVRLIGVGASKIKEVTNEYKQLSIFDSLDDEQKSLEISKLIKEINDELGDECLYKGMNPLYIKK